MGYDELQKFISVGGRPWKEGWDEFLMVDDGCNGISEGGGGLTEGEDKFSELCKL
jgi:hypothetical protein